MILWIHKEVEGYKMLAIGFSHHLYAPHFPECEDFEGWCVCPEIEDEVI